MKKMHISRSQFLVNCGANLKFVQICLIGLACDILFTVKKCNIK